MDIRRAGSDDAVELTGIINLAFQVEKFFIAGDRIDAAQVRELQGRGEFLMAAGAGCVYIEPRGERCYLGLLSVHPASQRTGLGRRLMQAAEDRSRELGCGFMDLRVVNLRVELFPFYRHLGYAEVGTSDFIPGVATLLPCHMVNLSKALR